MNKPLQGMALTSSSRSQKWRLSVLDNFLPYRRTVTHSNLLSSCRSQKEKAPSLITFNSLTFKFYKKSKKFQDTNHCWFKTLDNCVQLQNHSYETLSSKNRDHPPTHWPTVKLNEPKILRLVLNDSVIIIKIGTFKLHWFQLTCQKIINRFEIFFFFSSGIEPKGQNYQQKSAQYNIWPSSFDAATLSAWYWLCILDNVNCILDNVKCILDIFTITGSFMTFVRREHNYTLHLYRAAMTISTWAPPEWLLT